MIMMIARRVHQKNVTYGMTFVKTFFFLRFFGLDENEGVRFQGEMMQVNCVS